MDDSEHEPLLELGAVVKTRSLGLAVVPGMTRMVSLRVPLQTAERNAEGGARPLRLVTVRRARRRRRSDSAHFAAGGSGAAKRSCGRRDQRGRRRGVKCTTSCSLHSTF